MQCPKCSYEPTLSEVQRSPADCVHCGVNYDAYAENQRKEAAIEKARQAQLSALSPAVRDVHANYPGARAVVLVDIQMSFGSIVRLMVKWALATVPAAIIVGVIAVMAIGAFRAVQRAYETPAPVASVPSENVKRAFPSIYVPSDGQASYEVIDLERAGTNAVITTRRVGRSGVVGYSKRFIDCSNATWRYLGEGSSIDAMNANEAVNTRPGLAKFENGSVAQFVAKKACEGIPRTHYSLL